jgi:hypothetical protein
MTFAAEGHLLIIASVGVSALVFALALCLRSWPVWLAGLACTVGALLIAWQYRLPLPTA